MLAVQAYCLASLAWLWIGLLGTLSPHFAAAVWGGPGKEATSEEQADRLAQLAWCSWLVLAWWQGYCGKTAHELAIIFLQWCNKRVKAKLEYITEEYVDEGMNEAKEFGDVAEQFCDKLLNVEEKITTLWN